MRQASVESSAGLSLGIPLGAAPQHRDYVEWPLGSPGRLILIELGPAGSLSALEYRALNLADVVVYPRDLAPAIRERLPRGVYAEPASALHGAASPISERAVRFARDGWSAVQLVAHDAAGQSCARRIRAAADQLIAGGTLPDTPVWLVSDAGDGSRLTTETRLCAAHLAIDERGADAAPIIVVAAFAGGPARQPGAFTANGLAG